MIITQLKNTAFEKAPQTVFVILLLKKFHVLPGKFHRQNGCFYRKKQPDNYFVYGILSAVIRLAKWQDFLKRRFTRFYCAAAK